MSSRKIIFRNARYGFTLLDMVIVIGILGVLSVTLVLVLNPVELFDQARDSNRITEINTLNRAVQIYRVLGGQSMGTAQVVYVSLPDSSLTCANLALPSLPVGWTYHCQPAASFRQINGSGWVPIDFTSINPGSPFSSLPIDPINSDVKNLYYAYIRGNVVESYALAAFLESNKYTANNAALDGGSDPTRFEVGTNLTLLAQSTGLAGYWSFNGNLGDGSGNNNNGTFSGAPSYVPGQVGQGLSFNGSNYVTIPDSASLDLSSAGSITVWMNQNNPPNGSTSYGGIVHKGVLGDFSDEAYSLQWDTVWDDTIGMHIHPNGIIDHVTDLPNITLGSWYFLGATWDSSTVKTYRNGVLQTTNPTGGIVVFNSDGSLQIGCQLLGSLCFDGKIDEVKIYNKTLTPTEILNEYNATQ